MERSATPRAVVYPLSRVLGSVPRRLASPPVVTVAARLQSRAPGIELPAAYRGLFMATETTKSDQGSPVRTGIEALDDIPVRGADAVGGRDMPAARPERGGLPHGVLPGEAERTSPPFAAGLVHGSAHFIRAGVVKS